MSCSLNTSDILLEHGIVPAIHLNGHQATADVSLSCTDTTDVSVLLAGSKDGKIEMGSGGNVSSTLQINGTPLGENSEMFTVPAGGLSLSLKSTLVASENTPPGSLSGSATLIITPA